MKKSFTLSPRDLLFFRDGRPMDVNKREADMRNIGHGDTWPRPDHLYNGIMHALINDRMASGEKMYGKIGDLKVEGPLPMKGDTLYLPRPLDWDCKLVEVDDTDRPSYLKYGFVDCKDGKKDYPAWIPLEQYRKYLACDYGEPLEKVALYGSESRIGTTLDAETGASACVQGNASGQYQANYLRLERDVIIWGAYDRKDEDVAKSEVKGDLPSSFILGGQGGVVTVASSDIDLEKELPRPEPKPSNDGKYYVRWTVISPAYFSQTGWLPGWCKDTSRTELRKEDGYVCFKGCDNVRLIAAHVGKPIVFSGFDTQEGVKRTKLAVPAGSTYLFECPDEETAKHFVETVHLARKSDFGSQGFGMGVCSFVSLEKLFNLN